MKYNQLKIENFQTRIWVKNHQIQTPIVLSFFVPNSTPWDCPNKANWKKNRLTIVTWKNRPRIEPPPGTPEVLKWPHIPSDKTKCCFTSGIKQLNSGLFGCYMSTSVSKMVRFWGWLCGSFFIRVMEFSVARGSTLLYRWGRIARHGSSLSTCKGLSLAGGFLENCVSPLDDDADDGAVWRWRSWRSNFSSSRSMECCRSTILRKTRSPVAFWRSVNIWFGVKYDGRDSNRGLQMLSDNQHPAPEPFFIFDPKLIWVFLYLD